MSRIFFILMLLISVLLCSCTFPELTQDESTYTSSHQPGSITTKRYKELVSQRTEELIDEGLSESKASKRAEKEIKRERLRNQANFDHEQTWSWKYSGEL